MYEEFFGLTAKPFQLSPDAAFFYPSREHQRALSFLQYGLDQGDGFIVITGDVGTGKTMLVEMLLSQLDPRELLVATLVTTQLEEDDLLQLVASNFGIQVDAHTSKSMVLKDLERAFVEQRKMSRRVLLIVDEAQNLPARSIEELRMLSNFQQDSRPLVQVFLLGQQEFRKTLLSEGFEQLRQRVIATYHLNPLNEEEVQTYVEHRLSRAGWKQDPAFKGDVYPPIYAFTDGVPRRINNLCDRLLLYAFLEERHDIDHSVVAAITDELGKELGPGRVDQVTRDVQTEPSKAPPEPVGEPLESMARGLFDKANVQQRLAALERAIDNIGAGMKPEIAEIKEELSFIRLMLEDILHQVRSQKSSLNKKKSA